MGGKSQTKAIYFDKLKTLLEEYKSIFIVVVDNVSSQQMHEIRQSLRGDAVVLMGKNTMVRRAIKGFIADSPEYERLLPHVKGERVPEMKISPTNFHRQCRIYLHQRRPQNHSR